MSISAFDSALYGALFSTPDVGRLFTDNAEVRAMLLVEGALAKCQGELGLIPIESALAIHRASLEVQIDPSALAVATAQNGVPIPEFVAAFRKAMQAPEHSQYVHWGATSQDIIDTALILRLRQALNIIEEQILSTLQAMAKFAAQNAETPITGRTYGQAATVTSLGAIAASWGQPLLRHLTRLGELRTRLLCVSLSGAVGTSSVLGPQAPALRAALAKALNLGDPGGSWHSTRDTVAELAGWTTLVTGSLGKLGADLILFTQSGIAELTIASGGSSTMPQKQNPVGPSVLVALAQHTAALNTSMQLSIQHTQQRDGSAWFAEWLALPQMIMATARATSLAAETASTMTPNLNQINANLAGGGGLIYAEALSFALADLMPRPDAQAEMKSLCARALADNRALRDLVVAAYPQIDLTVVLSPTALLGQAPAEARQFHQAVAALDQ